MSACDGHVMVMVVVVVTVVAKMIVGVEVDVLNHSQSSCLIVQPD